MGQEYYARNGTYIHLNVAGNEWLSWVTCGVGPKIGVTRPLTVINAKLMARILHNFAVMHHNHQFLSKGGFHFFLPSTLKPSTSQDQQEMIKYLQDQHQLQIKEIKELCMINDTKIHEWVSAFFAQSNGLIDDEKHYKRNQHSQEFDYNLLPKDAFKLKESDRTMLNFKPGELPSTVLFDNGKDAPVKISEEVWDFFSWVSLGLWERPGLPNKINSSEGRIITKMANHIQRLNGYGVSLVKLIGIKENNQMNVNFDLSGEKGLKTKNGRENIDTIIQMLDKNPSNLNNNLRFFDINYDKGKYD